MVRNKLFAFVCPEISQWLWAGWGFKMTFLRHMEPHGAISLHLSVLFEHVLAQSAHPRGTQGEAWGNGLHGANVGNRRNGPPGPARAPRRLLIEGGVCAKGGCAPSALGQFQSTPTYAFRRNEMNPWSQGCPLSRSGESCLSPSLPLGLIHGLPWGSSGPFGGPLGSA